MNTYRIADLTVNMSPKGRTVHQAEKYLTDFTENPDITITYNEEVCKKAIEKYPDMTEDLYVYMALGKHFANELLKHNGLVLHSSAISYENKAYLFSADSGTGKSTHTNLWKQCFEGAEIINDDKPALRLIDDKFYAYGTPWSGSTPINKNVRIPLQAICFIERGDKNSIERITDSAEIIRLFLPQTLRQVGKDLTNKFFDIIEELIKHVSFYKLRCLPDEDAAKLAYSVMSK
jgi:hypothetical protein